MIKVHSHVCDVTINIIFSEICDSEEEGMKKFYDDYEYKELEYRWSCENCYNGNGKDCLEKNCCDKVKGYGETFKHTHTKECLCPYDEGTVYYIYDGYDIQDLKAIQEYIESGGDCYNFLRAFIDNLNDTEIEENNTYKWVCTELD